jgi:hypothetical protein
MRSRRNGLAATLLVTLLLLFVAAACVPVAPPGPVAVSVGYADGANGLSPWSGSPNTTFLGEGPQCCLTHGPDNGSNGYDSGAIAISNTSSSTYTLDEVSVDFGGGSTPSHFQLWDSALPIRVPPGHRVILTMDNAFNFDTSDLFGEACHRNSGVVPAVHVTVNGSTTTYLDDWQVLNSDGADQASCPGDISERHAFTRLWPGSQPALAPVNDVPPALTGPAVEHRVESALFGAWHASPPPVEALNWLRCDSFGGHCAGIYGATSVNYLPTSADVGHSLRVAVVASNSTGSAFTASAASPDVRSAASTSQLGNTSTGNTSLFITGPTELTSAVTAAHTARLNDLSFFARGAGNTQAFTASVYALNNGVRGALLASSSPVTVPGATNGRWYEAALPAITLNGGQHYLLSLTNSGAFNATYVGASTNAGISMFLDTTP